MDVGKRTGFDVYVASCLVNASKVEYKNSTLPAP
jgi:hypothetical protein